MRTENIDELKRMHCNKNNIKASEGSPCPECGSKETINYTINDIDEIWRCFECGCDFIEQEEVVED